MSLPDDNSPAIVNLALVGGTGDDVSISTRLSENLHRFKYDLITDGEGKSSFTYTIELINPNESFTQSLLNLYSASLKAAPASTKAIANDMLEGVNATTFNGAYFPKILVQWGYDYESDISKSGVHIAQITNVEYKFTQGKEKIFIISAVNTEEAFGELIKHDFTTPAYPVELNLEYNAIQGFMGDVPKGKYYDIPSFTISDKDNNRLGFSNIVIDQISDLLGSIPGTQSIPLHLDASSDIYFYKLLQETYSAFEPQFPEDRPLNIGTTSNGTPEFIKNDRIESMAPTAYEALRQLLGNVGCDIRNKNMLLNFTGNRAETASVDWEPTDAITNTGSRYISITKDFIKEDGTYGFSTEIVSPSQTANNGDLTKVYKAIEMDLSPNAVTKDFKYGTSKDGGSDSEHDELIEKGVEYWWDSYSYFPPIGSNEYNNDNWNFEFDALVEYSYLRINISKQHMESAKALEAEGIYIKSDIKLIIDIPSAIHNLPPALSTRLGIYSSQEILYSKELADASNIAGVFLAAESTYFNQLTGTLKTLLELQAELRAAKEKAQQDLYEEGLGEVFSQAQIDALKLEDMQKTTFENDLTYENLTWPQRQDLHYDDLIVTSRSPEDESVEDTARKILKSYNSLAPAEHHLGIMSTNQSYKETFEDVITRFKDNTLKPLTDIYFIGRRKDLQRMNNSSLRSYLNDDHGTITLNYGSGDSNQNLVKYFDFKSDNRFLANLMSTLTFARTIKDYSKILSYQNIENSMDRWKETLSRFIGVLKEANNSLYTSNKESFDIVLAVLESGSTKIDGFRIADSYFSDIKVVSDLIKQSVSDKILHDYTQYSNSIMYTIANETAEDAFSTDIQSLYIFFEALLTPILVAKLLVEDSKGNNYVKGESLRSHITDKLADNFNIEFPAYRDVAIIDPPEINPNEYTTPLFYVLNKSNIFDTKSNLSEDFKAQMDFFIKNINQAWEVRVKCIGIPIMDTHLEIAAPRVIKLNIEDFSPSNDSKNLINKYATGTHWLSGAYRPIAISHEINTAGGYSTEFKLLKHYGGLAT